MAKKSFFNLLLVALLVCLVTPAFALEKVKLGTAVKMDSVLYLPVLATDGKGLWKENGLDEEWVPFVGMTALMQAAAHGAISIGFAPVDGPLLAADKGVPVIVKGKIS